MGNFNDNQEELNIDLEELVSRVNIVDYVSQYFELEV